MLTLEQICVNIRANCKGCEGSGVGGTETAPDGETCQAIECQYCGELIRAIRAAVAAAVAARDAQVRDEVATALQGLEPPLLEEYAFDPLTLRVAVKQAQAAAVAEEREACAQLAETGWSSLGWDWQKVGLSEFIATAIRARARASGGNGGEGGE
jgi:hypothetical protein